MVKNTDEVIKFIRHFDNACLLIFKDSIDITLLEDECVSCNFTIKYKLHDERMIYCFRVIIYNIAFKKYITKNTYKPHGRLEKLCYKMLLFELENNFNKNGKFLNERK